MKQKIVITSVAAICFSYACYSQSKHSNQRFKKKTIQQNESISTQSKCPFKIIDKPTKPPKCTKIDNSHYMINYFPDSLFALTFSEIIVVGKIEGIVEYRHTPPASTNASQHTIYAFRVEQTLKGRHLPWRKIYQHGGPLPWSEDGISGVGYRRKDAVFLISGERYILFLRDPSTFGLEIALKGRDGSGQNFDEYAPSHEFMGKILIKGDKLFSPDTENNRPYTFTDPIRDHIQIHNKNLYEIIETIKTMLKSQQDPYRKNNK
jgi:hypothetical protein